MIALAPPPPLRPPRPPRPSVTPTRPLNVNLGLCFGILVCPLDLLPACRGCVCEAAQRQAPIYPPSLSFLSVVSSHFVSPSLHLSLSLKHSLCCLTFSIIFIISSQRAHFLNFTAPHFVCVSVSVCVCVGVCCQQVVLLCRLKSAVKQCHSPAPVPRPLCLRLSGYGSAHAAMHIWKLNSG